MEVKIILMKKKQQGIAAKKNTHPPNIMVQWENGKNLQDDWFLSI